MSIEQQLEKNMRPAKMMRPGLSPLSTPRFEPVARWLYTWFALLVGLTLGVPSHAQESSSANIASPTGLVDALNGVFGKQTTGRAIHAKGIVLEGTFVANSTAHSLSKAAHLNTPRVPIIVRFSNFAGIPTIADTDPLATPRGMALKFSLPDGTATDVVAHSFNGFPTKTAEDFRLLMVALGNSKPGVAAPTPADVFMSTHPTAKSFFDHLPSPPESFATAEYFGVNSFQFTNAAGRSRYGRYQLLPNAGVKYLPKEIANQVKPDYLEEKIGDRVPKGAVQFLLRVQLAMPGDAIDDPSVAWPESRPTVDLGVITITRIDNDSDTMQEKLLFTPTAVTAGIATADPMIEARNSAYGVSYARRHQTH
jgi:catalase